MALKLEKTDRIPDTERLESLLHDSLRYDHMTRIIMADS